MHENGDGYTRICCATYETIGRDQVDLLDCDKANGAVNITREA